jgi:outer membrane protein assembly factor BamB
MVRSAASPAEDLYRLADGLLPPGKVVTEIEIVAQLAWGGGFAATAEILYQRQGIDTVPVTSGPLTIPGSVFQEFRQRFSALNWSAAELDALEIGLRHIGGGTLLMTQNYVKVTYGETLVHPVDVFTAGSSGDSTNGQVMLNWLNPSYGLYDRTVIRRDTVCPVTATDGVPVVNVSNGLGNPGSFVDTVPLGPTYFYTAFVLDSEDRASTGVCKSATPFDRTAGRVEWRYDTSISVLTTPGLRVNVPLNQSVVYSVANDGLVHAIRGGSSASGGGSWPAGFRPFLIGSPAQARPPVVPLPAPLSTLAVLLGSQDGRAYAVDALTGALIWRSAVLGTNVQAAPAAVLSASPFLGGADLVFVATRNTGGPNRLYALDATDGSVAWYFDNGGDPTGIGEIVSGASVDYAGRRVFFTSALGASSKTTWCLNYLVTPPAMCSGWTTFGVAPGAGDIQASPILFQGWLFVSETSAGDLYRINPGDGLDSLVFNLAGGGAKGFVFPQFGTTNLFASTSTETLSVNYSSGTSIWTGACVATPSTPTAVPGTDWVFVGSSVGKLFQFSASGGTGCPTPLSACIGDCLSTIVGAPAFDVLKTMLYVGTDEGKIYGVRAPF